MKIRKMLVLMLILSLLAALPLHFAAAESRVYTFPSISAQLDADFSEFSVVLTPDNLAENASWFASQGQDPDGVQTTFRDEGILLSAIDVSGGRELVITALNDVDGQMYFDLNEQDESMRGDYRRSHTNGSVYGILGYDYQSSTWRNYGKNVDRFLRLKYSLKQGDDVSYVGYQRRTIRNGYTITIDLRVHNRKLKTSDEKYIDKIMSGFSFTDIKSAPAGACKLTVTTEPPKESGSETFTLAGKTEKDATVTATLISMTSQTTKTFSDTASSKGAYSIKLTYPEGGTYSLVITSQAPDGRTAQLTYVTTYQRNLLPVNFTAEVPAQLTGDTLKIAGTTLSGAKTQIAVTGPTSYSKTKTGKSFSFEIDTSLAGTYQILITVSKSNLNTRSFSYTAVRTLSEAETRAKIKAAADDPSYKKLTGEIAKYAGQTLGYKGYVLEVTQTGPEWTVKFALTKSGTTYKDIVYVIAKEDPALTVGSEMRMYGTLSADAFVETVEGSGTSSYPKFNLVFFDAV